jgi:hypothetical protein
VPTVLRAWHVWAPVNILDLFLIFLYLAQCTVQTCLEPSEGKRLGRSSRCSCRPIWRLQEGTPPPGHAILESYKGNPRPKPDTSLVYDFTVPAVEPIRCLAEFGRAPDQGLDHQVSESFQDRFAPHVTPSSFRPLLGDDEELMQRGPALQEAALSHFLSSIAAFRLTGGASFRQQSSTSDKALGPALVSFPMWKFLSRRSHSRGNSA